MKALRLFKALSMVDEKWVEEAWDYQPPVRKRHPALYGLAAAACCTLFCAFGFFYLVTGGFHGFLPLLCRAGAAADGPGAGHAHHRRAGSDLGRIL